MWHGTGHNFAARHILAINMCRGLFVGAPYNVKAHRRRICHNIYILEWEYGAISMKDVKPCASAYTYSFAVACAGEMLAPGTNNVEWEAVELQPLPWRQTAQPAPVVLSPMMPRTVLRRPLQPSPAQLAQPTIVVPHNGSDTEDEDMGKVQRQPCTSCTLILATLCAPYTVLAVFLPG